MSSGPRRVLLTVNGVDRPGILHPVCQVLARHRVPVLDIEQASTHRLLSLSFVIDLGHLAAEDEAAVVKELLYEGWRLHTHIQLEPMKDADFIAFSELTEAVNRDLYAVTLIGNEVGADALAAVAGALASRGANITNIHKLSSRRVAAVEMIARGLDLDVAVQRENLYRRSKRLVVFDMDSTLIEEEVIDEVARAVGCHGEVAALTARAMRGELDFAEAFVARVALLRGARLDEVVARVEPTLTLKPGAAALIRVLKKLGYKLAVISGGFSAFVDPLKQRLGLDYAFSNELDVEARPGDGGRRRRQRHRDARARRARRRLQRQADRAGRGPGRGQPVEHGLPALPARHQRGRGRRALISPGSAPHQRSSTAAWAA
jgi:phosphoserine phosphatase